jgi:hypothetical protein
MSGKAAKGFSRDRLPERSEHAIVLAAVKDSSRAEAVARRRAIVDAAVRGGISKNARNGCNVQF